MKKNKNFVVGLLMGITIATGGTVLASSADLIMQNVKFKINGKIKELPSNYEVLNYNGHTYVPARFIAEELDADVKWDEESRTVVINQAKNDVPDENNSEETPTEIPDENQTNDNLNFSDLPVTKMVKGVSLEVYDVIEKDDYTRFFIRVDNTTSKKIQINQRATTLKTTNTIYNQTDPSGNNVLYWNDNTWYRDIEEDDTVEGYITLPPIPEDEKSGQLYIEAIVNDHTQEPIEFKFDIKWK